MVRIHLARGKAKRVIKMSHQLRDPYYVKKYENMNNIYDQS